MRLKKIAAAVLCCAVTVLSGCGAERQEVVPETLTLLIEDENRILTMSYTEYIAGCIFAAADPSFQRETLVAAGIALSSQTRFCLQKFKADLGADLCDRWDIYPEWLSPDDDEDCGDDRIPGWQERVWEAAETAAQMCLYYNGEPAYTPCCRVSSGRTDDGGYEYLPAMKLSRDADSPEYSARAEYTCERVRSLLAGYTGKVVLPPDKAEWFTDPVRTKSGALRSVCFGGSQISGEQLRRALGLRSTEITILQEHDSFIFETSGSGGNLGMSVYTAELMARSGMSAEEILEVFFPGTRLVYINSTTS